jgi:drug/metabolite transporter (DMT)-like permease
LSTKPQTIRSHSLGTILVIVSAVAFSTAGYFTRLVAVDVWTMLFWRGLFGGLLILGYIVATQHRKTGAAFTAIGPRGLAAAACSTIATICFITALRTTTVADVTVLYATAPFIAAVLAWVWFGERPVAMTLAASTVALAGVAIMCGAAFSAGNSLGDALALAMTALMALMMVIVRGSRTVSMVPASCLSAFACSILVLPLAHPIAVTLHDLTLLALFGTSQFGLGLLLLTLGTRLMPASRASLLSNLELPFAPLWVWIAFGELPGIATYVGGSIICVAVLVDLIADAIRVRRIVPQPAE